MLSLMQMIYSITLKTVNILEGKKHFQQKNLFNIDASKWHTVEKTFCIENVEGQHPANSEEPPEGKLDTCDLRVEVVRGKDQW